MNKLKFHIALFLLSLVVGNGVLMSQSAILFRDITGVQQISSKFEIFEDKSSNCTVEMLMKDSANLFELSKQKIPSFSFTKSSIWCRFSVDNQSGTDCYLEVAPPILNEVVLYQVYDDRIDSVFEGSYYTDTEAKVFKSNNYVFKLDSSARYYLLKVKSRTRLFIKAHIGAYEALVEKTRDTDTIQGIYAGLIFMIFIYNLFLYFTNREKIYLYYLMHLLNSAIFFLYMSGFGIEFIWKNFPSVNFYFITVIGMGFILSLMFVINFLDTRENLPRLHKSLIIVGISLIINSIIDISGYSHLAGKILNYIGFVGILMIVFGALKLVRMGFRPAFTFLYAWLLYLVGIAIQTMQSLNFIPTNEITSNTIQIGSAFEIILLSLAVGNKINFYKEKKLSAMTGEKELLQQKEGLKNNQKEQLEIRFQEQTEQVYAKNRELKKQNKEIKAKHKEIFEQNRKIVEYHDLLEAKNMIITSQNEDLLLHKENLEQLIDERTFELKEATSKAEKADQLKTAFLKDFSHEIRTPMNAISGFSSLLMDIEPDDPLHDYYAEIIINHTDNLLELIDNIVDLSRIQTNSLYLKKVKFDPAKMFTFLLEKLQEKLKREKKSFINLRLVLPSNKNIRLNLDYNRFWKIVYQLVDNSIKYTEAGYIEFGYNILNDNSDIEVFVVDTGVGIKKEKLAYVFDSFRRDEDSSNKLYSGTGMGLSLVKGLVKLMGGDVIIETTALDESVDNQTGTTIKLLIPNAIIFEEA